MRFQVDLLLKGEEHATTETVESAVGADPRGWTETDVGAVLKTMLTALDRRRHPGQPDRPVFLRGISWIVDPDRSGGMLIALEIPTGAAVAGPFDIGQRELEAMIARVMTPGAPPAASVH